MTGNGIGSLPESISSDCSRSKNLSLVLAPLVTDMMLAVILGARSSRVLTLIRKGRIEDVPDKD